MIGEFVGVFVFFVKGGEDDVVCVVCVGVECGVKLLKFVVVVRVE